MYHTPRLRGYDYTQSGFYFITIDCFLMECRFGHILHGRMVLNELGLIAQIEWFALSVRYTNVCLHTFQVMPNHLHGIIEIKNEDLTSPPQYSLSDIIGAYKSLVANNCLIHHKYIYAHLSRVPLFGKLWSRSFNDKIIRDRPVYKSISRYIKNNPKKWNRQ